MDHFTMLDINLLVLKMLVIRRRRERENRRRYWVHPLTAQRRIKGSFSVHYEEMRKFPRRFFNYCRMSVSTFDCLLQLVQGHIARRSTHMRLGVSPEERLLVTLRFLAAGESFSSLHVQYLLGKSTISNIVHETCCVLWECLQPLVMPEPTEQLWTDIAEGFYKRSQFPNCVGALDGKHIRVQKPRKSATTFYNYKNFCSVVLMAIADSSYNFVAVDVGAYVSSSDSSIFHSSAMGHKFYEGSLNFPAPRPIVEGGSPMPHVLVADEAFRLHENMMKPFPKRALTTQNRVFNYRLTRARRYVECTFGILSNKWKVLQTGMQVKPGNAEGIIKATCVLHNFVRQREGYNVDDMSADFLKDFSVPTVRGTHGASVVRTRFAEYFMSPAGELAWQYSKI